MSADSRLPRTATDPNYLLRLRERAFARMKQDEDAVLPASTPAFDGPVTRRWTLQRMAMVAAALTPAATTLQAAAAGFRCPAPQYGAPGFYPSVPAPMTPDLTTHADLGLPESWKRTQRLVLSTPHADLWSGAGSEIWTLAYRLPSGTELALDAVLAGAPYAYVAHGNASLYIVDKDELYGVRFGDKELVLSPSLFRMPLPANGMFGLIGKFAEGMSDGAMAKAAAREYRIPLTGKGVPEDFWKPAEGDTRRDFRPYLQFAGVDDGVFKFQCSGPSNKHWGTFSVDLRTRRLTGFDGK